VSDIDDTIANVTAPKVAGFAPASAGADMERYTGAGQGEVRLRAGFKLDILLRHLEAGRDCRTQLLDLAVLPWPLRDAMGQDLAPAFDVLLLQGKRQRVVINRQTALDAERWWPAL